MNLKTIILRELRLQSRNRWTYWQRVGFAGLPLIMCLWVFAGSNRDPGQEMLVVASVVSMLLFGFGAALAVSDVICSERREGTLGLLFLTSLRSWELLLGLAISAGARFLLCLIAIMPVLLLPLLTGGVHWPEVLRECLNVLIVVWLGISVGLFWSAVCREAKTSALCSVVTLLLVCLLPFGLAVLITAFTGGRLTTLQIAIGGPMFLAPLALTEVIQTESLLAYLVSVTSVSMIGLVFFLFSYRTFMALWIREASGLAVARTRRRSSNRVVRWFQQDWVTPTLSRKLSLRFPDELSPYYVLTKCYSRDLPFLRILVPLVVCIYLVVAAFSSQLAILGSRMNYYEGAFGILLLLDFLVRFNAAIEAPRQIISDRRSGMLELILTTPLHNREIVPALLDGSSDAHRGKTAVLVAMHLLQSLLLIGGLAGSRTGMEGLELFVLHLGLALFVPWEMRVLRTLGIFWGLRGVNAVRIFVQLFSVAYLFPVLLILLFSGGLGMRSGTFGLALVVVWHGLRLFLWRFLLDRSKPNSERVRESVTSDGV